MTKENKNLAFLFLTTSVLINGITTKCYFSCSHVSNPREQNPLEVLSEEKDSFDVPNTTLQKHFLNAFTKDVKREARRQIF